MHVVQGLDLEEFDPRALVTSGKVKKSEAEKTNIRRKLDETIQKMNTLDEAKNALQKEVGDLRSSLREVEKARLEARRELQQVHNQVWD